MWERKSLKAKAKEAFKFNYWKCVLVALVLSLAIGGGASSGGSSGSNFNSSSTEDSRDTLKDLKDIKSGISKGGIDGLIDEITEGDVTEKNEIMAVAATIGMVFLIIIVVALVVGVCISAFVLNPLEVGCRKYFVDNLSQKADLNQMGLGFKPGYMNVVKTMFFKDLYIFLWSLLLIIPGIIKGYEYMLVPYLVAEHPEMSTNEILDMSRELMDGNKWKAFVLKLSFIGWELLSILTCGILSVFYVNPYRFQTEAALYDALVNGADGHQEEYVSYVEM